MSFNLPGEKSDLPFSSLTTLILLITVITLTPPAFADGVNALQRHRVDRPGDGDISGARGLIVARERALLSSQIAGRINQLTVRVGQKFKKGQLLASIDCIIWKANLDKASAVRRSAKARVATIEALTRSRSAAAIELAMARSEADQADAEMRINQKKVRQCRIVAPFEGTVVALKHQRYEHVAQGEPLLEIVNPKALEVDMRLPAHWLVKIKVKAKLLMKIEENGKTVPIRIARIAPEIHPVSRSINVIGILTGNHPELIPGMSGPLRWQPILKP